MYVKLHKTTTTLLRSSKGPLGGTVLLYTFHLPEQEQNPCRKAFFETVGRQCGNSVQQEVFFNWHSNVSDKKAERDLSGRGDLGLPASVTVHKMCNLITLNYSRTWFISLFMQKCSNQQNITHGEEREHQFNRYRRVLLLHLILDELCVVTHI